MRGDIDFTISGPDIRALGMAVHAWECFSRPPTRVSFGGTPVAGPPNWMEKYFPRLRSAGVGRGDSLMARWEHPQFLDVSAYHKMVTGNIPQGPIDPLEWLRRLTPLPFEQAVLASPHDLYAWGRGYIRPGLVGPHHPLGVAAAFRGAGHAPFVSRRWLHYGPWRVTYGPDDLTLIQFHDEEEADPAVALEQARPGHFWLGNDDNGGYLQSNYLYEHSLDGNYHHDRRVLELVVNGREITQCEMRDARAAVRGQALGPTMPLDNVAFMFVAEDEARAHLHRLWLNGLECWTILRGEEVRLDLDYTPPPPVRPDWVRKVEAREAARGAGPGGS